MCKVMRKRVVIGIFTILSIFALNGQSHLDLGFNLGLANYSGDLSPTNVGPVIAQSHFSAGAILRYNVNSRFSARANFVYAGISGSDALSGNETMKNRNLSFYSDILEASIGLEINVFSFSIIEGESKFTPYGAIGFGVFKFDPIAEFEGNLVRLQPLGTEGQGTSASSQAKYSLVQMNIPFGGGVKVKFSEQITGFAELSFRRTFTDYLDDVSSTYPDFEILQSETSELAVSLSDRSIIPVEAGGVRGGPTVKDYYATGVIGLSFSFNRGGSNISLRKMRPKSKRRVSCPKF